MCRTGGHSGACGGSNGSNADAAIDSPPSGRGGVTVAVAAGNHTCAVCGDNTLWCWGQNDDGETSGSAQQTCTGATVDCSPMPVQVDLPNATTIRAVQGGVNNTFAIADVSGIPTLFGWGDNSAGQFAMATPPTSRTALNLGFNGLTDVGGGDFHSCVIQAGRVSCEGENSSGQLGVGDTIAHSGPVSFAAPASARLALHGLHSCVMGIQSGATLLKCWGDNVHGQSTGTGSSNPATVPFTVFAQGVTSIAAGSQHTCAIVSGNVHCWGANGQGQCAQSPDGTDIQSGAIVPFAGAVDIAAGGTRTCARTFDGQIACWGSEPPDPVQPSPTAITLPHTATTISVGRFHSCSILDDKTLWCWGGNQYGQLGDGTHDMLTHAPTRVTVCD
jgi:alpha-tubulin suppressor-like RCC1 family protein